jgi:glycine cleavage system protein P-like pyridoxal-binding family
VTTRRRSVFIPDSAHGTNPASVTFGGYEVTTVPSNDRGLVDLEALKASLGPDVAGIMLTNPNTWGSSKKRSSTSRAPCTTSADCCTTTART